MTPRSIEGKRALVTGASSGLGADFARELARRGSNLIIVARRTEALENLARELRAQGNVDVAVVSADLSLSDAAQDLYGRIESLRLPVDILINNAGLGLYGRSPTIPWAKEHAMLEVDVVTVAGLTKLFLPQMLDRRFGYILNVSSTAAYQPTPYYASYSAAKAFVLQYSEALHYELRGTGVSVTVVSPGITATEFLQVSGQQATPYQRLTMMQSPDVVRIAIRAMLAGKPTVVPGLANSVLAFLARLSPPALSVRGAERSMRSNEPDH